MASTPSAPTVDLLPDGPLRVAFLLQPHFSLLAFTAAADALTTANLVAGKQIFVFDTFSIDGQTTLSDLGIPIACRSSRLLTDERAASIANALFVCGGYRCDLDENKRTSELLRQADQSGMILGGIWNGIVSLAHAGLMDGHACAIHPNNQAQASSLFPHLRIREDAIVIDRQRYSAAGPNSAFELMLVLVQRYHSAETVQKIRQILSLDAIATESATSALQRDDENHFPAPLKLALQLMRSNLDEPLSKHDLSIHTNLSTRALERLFNKYLHTSPAKHYMQLRLQRADELIIQTRQTLGEISDACGFVSSAHFSRAFHRHYGYAPSTLRRSIKGRL